MIYMFLSPTDDLGENELFSGQKTTQVFYPCFWHHSEIVIVSHICTLGVHNISIFYLPMFQIVLLLLALVAVPWMLLPKPFIMKRQHENVNFWDMCWTLELVNGSGLAFTTNSKFNVFVEASGWVIYSPSSRRKPSRGSSKRFSWRAWGVWIQWSAGASAHSYYRVRTWSSFEYCFIPSIMGIEVLVTKSFQQYLQRLWILNNTKLVNLLLSIVILSLEYKWTTSKITDKIISIHQTIEC